MALPDALAPLLAYDNFVVWRLEVREQRPTKPPRQARYPERYASVGDPRTWAPYAMAEQTALKEKLKGSSGGIGFVLHNSKVSGIDLDKCVDDEGNIIDWAVRILRECGSYAEISPSGNGVRIFGLTEKEEGASVVLPAPDGGKGRIEAYRHAKRFLTITGRQISQDSKLVVIDAVIDRLHAEKGGSGTKTKSKKNGHSNGEADSSSSGVFDKAVCRLFEKGLEPDEVAETMRKHPRRYQETKAAQFESERRLLKEVQRCWDKWQERHKEQLAVEWSNGRVPLKTSCADIRIAINALGARCSYDIFHDKSLIELEELGIWQGEVSDNTVLYLRKLIFEQFSFEPGKDATFDAVAQLCLENKFDPVLDYLNGLEWDGKSRLDDWVMKYLGCPDTELNRMIGRLTLIAAVRRVRQPGVKFDQIIVLEGEEGTMKSTAILALAGAENFSDQTILGRHMKDREQQEMLAGRWLYEIADLKGIEHADVESVKAFASRTHDRARPAYGRKSIDQPRRCVLFATTNDTSYLKGDTGNRRFWPLPTGRVKIELLRRDRDQLWAEAVEMEEDGGSLALPQHLWGEAKVEQQKRQDHHPWMEILTIERGAKFDLGGTFEERLDSNYLLMDVLKITPGQQKVGHWKQLATCMKKLGWAGPEPMRVTRGGPVMKGYRRLL